MSKKSARKTGQKGEPIFSLDKMGEPIIDPAPDKPPTWEDTVPAKALFRGGTWGMAVGLAAALYYESNHSVFGIYIENLALVLLVGVGAGFMAGAFVGWLSAKITGKNNLPPTSWLDTD
jgi:hypothetical protein